MDLLSFLASDLYEYLDRLSAFGLPASEWEGIQERRMGPRKEILELALECEVLDVLEAPGSASSRRK